MKKLISTLNVPKIIHTSLLILFIIGLIATVNAQRYDLAIHYVILLILTAILISNRQSLEDHAKLIRSYKLLTETYEQAKVLREQVITEQRIVIQQRSVQCDLQQAAFEAYKKSNPATPNKNVKQTNTKSTGKSTTV